jgi:hypothetical protein
VKKLKTLFMITIIFMVGLSLYLSVCNTESIRELKESRKSDQDKIAFLERQVQDIQENYVSFEALQPVLTDFENYQLEQDNIRNNLNDWNGLWEEFFGYEQAQYMLRGR